MPTDGKTKFYSIRRDRDIIYINIYIYIILYNNSIIVL